MKVDINYKIRTLDGDEVPKNQRVPILDKNGNQAIGKNGKFRWHKSEPFTLRIICERTLSEAEMETDPRTGQQKVVQIPGEKKSERWELAKRIHASDGVIDLQSEEITLLKELINKKYPSPLIVGQAREALDPTGEDKKKK